MVGKKAAIVLLSHGLLFAKSQLNHSNQMLEDKTAGVNTRQKTSTGKQIIMALGHANRSRFRLSCLLSFTFYL